MYKNTGAEFSNSTYKGSKGGVFSVISTLHLTSSTLVDPKTFMKNFNVGNDYFMQSILTANDHNHPNNTLPSGYMLRDAQLVPRPSYMDGSRGHVDYHNTIDNDFSNVKFRLFSKGKYFNYDSNGAN